MKRISLLAAALLVSFPAMVSNVFAECSGVHCRNVKIERIYVRSNGVVSVSTNGNEQNLNCTPESNIYLTLPDNHNNKKEIYAMLLSSKLTDGPIWIRVGQSPGSPCIISYTVLE